MRISIPYGRTRLNAEIPEARLRGILCSHLERYQPPLGEAELVEQALAAPIGSEPLETLAKGKQNIVLIASDHTRPVPSRILVPPMLAAIRRGNPNAEITSGEALKLILLAAGYAHRNSARRWRKRRSLTQRI